MIILAILIYLISFYGVWKFSQKFFSIGGRWEGSSPQIIDLFVTFFPIINTIVFITMIIINCENKNILLKFYRIKK
jgi:hypothetical protein